MANMVCYSACFSFYSIDMFVGCPPRIPPKAWSLFIIELISWIDCSIVDKLSQLKARNDDLTEDFSERMHIAQTLRDMGNVKQTEKKKENRMDLFVFFVRMNMQNIILKKPFVIMPKASNFYYELKQQMNNKLVNSKNFYSNYISIQVFFDTTQIFTVSNRLFF